MVSPNSNAVRRALRQRRRTPEAGPLLAAGRHLRPGALFHRLLSPVLPPLLEFVHSAPVDEQVAVDPAPEALPNRIYSR